MILIVKRVDPHNIGDYHCNPASYFDLGEVRVQDIYKRFDFTGVEKVIVGGGGMFHFVPQMQELGRTMKPLICWSAGTNKHESTELDYSALPLDRFALLGLRDRGEHHLPCVSCMNELIEPKQGFGVRCYQHKDEKHLAALGFPTLQNNCHDLRKVIEFLNGGETIITNTYHGWYWSVLLGKRVILYRPFSNKFFFLPYPVPVANTPEEVVAAVRGEVPVYPEALQECRQANREFYRKVMEL